MSKAKILVVDDDRLVLATLTHGLAQAGYDIIDADNGDDAILLARQHRPELALLDIRMEGMSGFDVAAYLRESLQTPFMFLSAFADDATVAQVKALGAVAYLVKPLDIAQIIPTVEAALTTVRARKAAAGALAPTPTPHVAPEHVRPDPFAPAPPASGYGTPHEPSASPVTAPNNTPDPLADPVAIAVGC
jgi:DNA-binding response OmpR family regulator